MESYEYLERLAICIESGVPYTEAKRIADSELPKEESEAVKRVKLLRAKIAQDKFDKRNYREKY